MKSRLSKPVRFFLAGLVVSFGAIAEVQAGTITAASLVPGCGRLVFRQGILITTASFNEICSMEIQFTVTNNPNPGIDVGRAFLVEDVLNNTALGWTDFHMELGFGVGSGFRPVGDNCGVGFVSNPLPQAEVFTAQGVSSSVIDWGGGTIPSGESVLFNFNINVSDVSACIPLGSLNRNGYSFTLRQTPTTVPEPTTMLLLGTGLAGVALKTRKRRKRRRSSE